MRFPFFLFAARNFDICVHYSDVVMILFMSRQILYLLNVKAKGVPKATVFRKFRIASVYSS